MRCKKAWKTERHPVTVSKFFTHLWILYICEKCLYLIGKVQLLLYMLTLFYNTYYTCTE